MSQYESVADLPQDCREAVYDLALVLADSKHVLGLRYGEWLGAPVIESAIAANAMAQDEFGHARLFYHVAGEFEKSDVPAREDKPEHYRNMEVLDSAFPEWTDFVAANALVDTALLVQLESLRESRFQGFRKLVPKLVQEERFHLQHAQGWLLQLGRANAQAKQALQASVKKLWEPVLCWFGRPGSAAERALVEGGIQDADGDGLRTRWIEQVGPVLERAGLDLPISTDAVTGESLLSSELSWDGFDPAFRRFSKTGPDAETFAQIACFSHHGYPVGS